MAPFFVSPVGGERRRRPQTGVCEGTEFGATWELSSGGRVSHSKRASGRDGSEGSARCAGRDFPPEGGGAASAHHSPRGGERASTHGTGSGSRAAGSSQLRTTGLHPRSARPVGRTRGHHRDAEGRVSRCRGAEATGGRDTGAGRSAVQRASDAREHQRSDPSLRRYHSGADDSWVATAHARRGRPPRARPAGTTQRLFDRVARTRAGVRLHLAGPRTDPPES